MRFMILIKATADSEAGVMPSSRELEEMGKFNEELVKAGILLDGGGLHDSGKGTRVHFAGGKRTVVEGPFSATEELVAGYWILQVKSREEAVEWVKRCPLQNGQIEIRKLFEAEDFGEAFTPELREHEEGLRSEIAAQSAAR
jgi:hypothetical protein